MMMFSAIILDPASLAAWGVLGLVLGWLAGVLIEPPTYGVPGDLFLGAVGGLLGGFFFGVFSGVSPNFWVSLGVALMTACVFIGGARIYAARSA